jgi:glycosyltransferase involved in cell wall biosynthesis
MTEADSLTRDRAPEDRMMRCLWIGHHLPFPMDEGAKLYSGKLALAFSRSGAFVRMLGFGGEAPPAEHGERIECISVPGVRRRTVAGLLSSMPLKAALDATPGYMRLLERQLVQPWDVIVLDNYSAGWALDRCLAHRKASGNALVLVHVSHNHEEKVWGSMTRHASASIPHKLLLCQNHRKVSRLERRLARSVDLLTTITDDDARSFRESRPRGPILTLTPGYDGPVVASRTITTDTLRRAVIVGSFHWIVKRENLARFIASADRLFAEHGIELIVVGDVPQDLRSSLEASVRATRFAGFLSDLGPVLSQARIAVVPELIGGGFKLKFLDYFFARVPVATIGAAAAGLPLELRKELLTSEDFDGLARVIVEQIDQPDTLNRMQEKAFALAQSLYRWEDRGSQLARAIERIRHDETAGRTQQSPAAMTPAQEL